MHALSPAVVRPIFVIYPGKINVGPNNQLGIRIPHSAELLLCGEFSESFQSLVKEYGNALSFKRYTNGIGDNFYGLLAFTACTSKSAYLAALRTQVVIRNRFSGIRGARVDVLVQKAADNREVERIASLIH